MPESIFYRQDRQEKTVFLGGLGFLALQVI
jgi:hypothetical protein